MYYFMHPKFLKAHFPETDPDLLKLISTLSRDFNAAIVDRTNSVNTFCEVISQIPAVADAESFENILTHRAAEVVQDAVNSGKEIRLKTEIEKMPFISISVMVAITEQLKALDKDVRPSFKVLHKIDDPLQWPSLFDIYISDNSHIISTTTQMVKHQGSLNHIAININHGDLLFPSPYFAYKTDYNNELFQDRCDQWVWNYIEPIVDSMPEARGPATVPNVMTWLRFVLAWQWQTISNWIRIGRENITPDYVVAFFDTDRFQNWFLTSALEDANPQLLKTQTYWPCREYIRKYFDDNFLNAEDGYYTPEYLEAKKETFKTKEPLVRTTKNGKSTILAVDTEYRRLSE